MIIYIYNQVHGNKSGQRNEIADKSIDCFFLIEHRFVISICVKMNFQPHYHLGELLKEFVYPYDSNSVQIINFITIFSMNEENIDV